MVSWANAAEIAETIRPDTGLVVVETPANPTLELVDIAAVARQAGDVPVLVDNTFATPVLQQPARHGASLVLHSATKYLGGHGDVMGGVVAAGAEWVARLRQIRAVTGGLLHPLAAYELHRGLQTLPVRVRAQQATAMKVADWLSAQPEVEKVFYPDAHELVGRQLAGPGAVLAFTVAGGYDAAARVAGSLKLITHAVSLGGVDTLIQHPAALTHRLVAPEAKPADNLLRLSLGLEDPEDITEDLRQALEGTQP